MLIPCYKVVYIRPLTFSAIYFLKLRSLNSHDLRQNWEFFFQAYVSFTLKSTNFLFGNVYIKDKTSTFKETRSYGVS